MFEIALLIPFAALIVLAVAGGRWRKAAIVIAVVAAVVLGVALAVTQVLVSKVEGPRYNCPCDEHAPLLYGLAVEAGLGVVTVLLASVVLVVKGVQRIRRRQG